MGLLHQEDDELPSVSHPSGHEASRRYALATTATPQGWPERIIGLLATATIIVGCYLAFRDLALTGLTWDEFGDYQIAEDYFKRQSFLTNLDDPSQGRLSHLIVYASFQLFGEPSYFAFKLPFVLLGIASGFGLLLYLRAKVAPSIAVLTAGLYLTCPFFLAAVRAGATAGDSLVMVLSLAYIVTLTEWLKTARFWPYGLLCGVVCGCAIGAKWSCGVALAVVPLAWLVRVRDYPRSILDFRLWLGLFLQQLIALLFAVASSPTLTLGYDFIRSALEHSVQFDGFRLMQFGELRSHAPFYYIPAVLISKMSPVQLLLCVAELGTLLWALIRRRQGVNFLAVSCLLSLAPMVPLAMKGFQNAHYYVPFVPAVVVLSAVTLNRWRLSPRGWLRLTALLSMPIALLSQLFLSLWLMPDYLMAGRQFGRLFYGQFPGPAVNHCQGLPAAFLEIEGLLENGDAPRKAYVLESCDRIVRHNRLFGPVHPTIPISMYPREIPAVAHFLIIPSSGEFDADGVKRWRAYKKRRREAVDGCATITTTNPDYELWSCPDKEER